MNLGLNQKTAIITASSKGLGFAIAKELAKEGANVIIASRNQEQVELAIQAIQAEALNPEGVTGSAIDLSNTSEIDSFVKKHAAQFGGLDILITNTAGPKGTQLQSTTLDDVNSAYQQLVAPVFQLIKSAVPFLEKSDAGNILSIASMSAKQPLPGLLLSNLFRPAVTALTKTLSQELGPKGIRVNSILPGWISTNRSKQLLTSEGSPFQLHAVEQSIPMKRIGTPEEFAKAATFMVSPAASYISGIMLPVDGGLLQGLN